MKSTRRCTLLVAIALSVFLFAALPAHASGTGDDPAVTADVVSAQDLEAKAADEAAFDSFVASGVSSAATGTLLPLVIDAPYAYLYTPSHRQERSYWCGPASCQIVTHYWGRLYSQSVFAQFMGTTTSGTDFTKVDDALRKYSGKSYWYAGGVSNLGAFMGQCEYAIGRKRYPLIADVKIVGREWPNYVYDHSGHILPVEAFDERYTPYRVRVNDPYDEAYFAGGGPTYGHTTYSAYVVARGVYTHWRQAVVR